MQGQTDGLKDLVRLQVENGERDKEFLQLAEIKSKRQARFLEIEEEKLSLRYKH